MPKHIEMLYQDAVDNVRFAKQQQWSVTYYALLVYAAVFILKNFNPETCEPFQGARFGGRPFFR